MDDKCFRGDDMKALNEYSNRLFSNRSLGVDSSFVSSDDYIFPMISGFPNRKKIDSDIFIEGFNEGGITAQNTCLASEDTYMSRITAENNVGNIGVTAGGLNNWSSEVSAVQNTCLASEDTYMSRITAGNNVGNIGVTAGGLNNWSSEVSAVQNTCLASENNYMSRITAGNNVGNIGVTAGVLNNWNSGESAVQNTCLASENNYMSRITAGNGVVDVGITAGILNDRNSNVLAVKNNSFVTKDACMIQVSKFDSVRNNHSIDLISKSYNNGLFSTYGQAGHVIKENCYSPVECSENYLSNSEFSFYNKKGNSSNGFENKVCKIMDALKNSPEHIGFEYTRTSNWPAINVFIFINGDVNGDSVHIGDKIINL